MSDDKREALVARMAIEYFITVRPDLTPNAAAAAWRAASEDWRRKQKDGMRAALSEAERVVREDEREACICSMRHGLEIVDQHIMSAIRARGAAAGEATP